MRVTTSKSKNSESFYITQSYTSAQGKSTSKTIRKLGTLADLSKQLHTDREGVLAWANEQAALLRAGNFGLLDLERIAEEIEDVGRSEQRELESRMAVLLMHLLKWQYQPSHRGVSWQMTLKEQRNMIATARGQP